MSQETEYFQGLSADDAKHERCYWRRIGFIAFSLIALAFILAPLVGCTQHDIPICEKYQAQIVQNEDGTPGIFMDMANVKKLAKLVTGLSDGTCKIEAPQAQGRPM